LPKQQYRKVVYLVRDGRDAMVSYYHYLLAMQEKIDFLEMVRTGCHTPCKWHEHVEAWLSNPHASRMIVIKYEDLIKDAVTEMKRFCEFADIEREESHISMITTSASFNKLQNKERHIGMGTKHSNWQDGKLFFRRGKVGSFRDEMPEPVLQCFLDEAAQTLKKLGYDLD
jgi:hypothetical protein